MTAFAKEVRAFNFIEYGIQFGPQGAASCLQLQEKLVKPRKRFQRFYLKFGAR